MSSILLVVLVVDVVVDDVRVDGVGVGVESVGIHVGVGIDLDVGVAVGLGAHGDVDVDVGVNVDVVAGVEQTIHSIYNIIVGRGDRTLRASSR